MAIELIPKEQTKAEPKTYRVEDTFKLSETGDPYMITRVDLNKVNLVCLRNGNAWILPVDVVDDLRITEKEFDRITDGDADKFIPTDYKLIEI